MCCARLRRVREALTESTEPNVDSRATCGIYRAEAALEDQNLARFFARSCEAGDYSASREVATAIVARLKEHTPGLTLTHRDLAAEPLEHTSR